MTPRACLTAFASAALALALLASGAAESRAQGVAGCEPFDRIDPSRPVPIMKSVGLDAEDASSDGHKTVVWRYSGQRVTFMILDGTGIALALRAFKSPVTAEELQAWNRNLLFGKSFLDGEGGARLEMFLPMDGGICEELLRSWSRTCIFTVDSRSRMLPDT
ncbi:MAG: YbjN domain-containing protein [Deltaproteobacteria bacterium]|jgi:hypothetical protein|nr:YbjN domain-containing protein [Deltaproteobacteria bacterium]